MHIDDGALIGRLEPQDNYEEKCISPSVVAAVDFGIGTRLTELDDSEINAIGNC